MHRAGLLRVPGLPQPDPGASVGDGRHQLTPGGKTYVMQAYSHIVDDSLTGDSLPGLGDRLHLPEGWHYRARTPDRDLVLRAVAGRAHILQDELQNTYMQLMTQ